MSNQVWSLSVDLQTKTAVFQSGLADAARAARTSFQDIKSDADDMGRATSGSMMEARHGVMLLGEEFGVHLPRALTSFIASIGPIGAAMEAAFPFLAIAVGATLLLQHLEKLKQEGQQLTSSQLNFGTAVQNVFNDLDDKLLQAGIRADELNHNHFAALEKQLKLIDNQSFAELARAFDSIAKAGDASFAQLKASFTETFFQISNGAAGAKNALAQFKAQYDSLLAQHKDKEATDLLAGTLESAKKAKELMEAQQGGHGSDEKELAAQEKLIEALQDQVVVRQKVLDLKEQDGQLAKQKAVKDTNEDQIERVEGVHRATEGLIEATLQWGKSTRVAGGESSQALHQTEEFFKANADAARKAAQEELQAATQSFENQAEIEKAQLEQKKSAISNAEAAGLMTRRQALEANMGLIRQESGARMQALQQEVAAKRTAIQAEIDADNRAASQILAANGGNKSDPQYIAFLSEAHTKLAALDALTLKYNADVATAVIQEQTALTTTNTELSKLSNSWTSYFGKMKSETNDLAATIRGELQSSMTQATDAFAKGIAKSLVEGKSFTKEMMSAARQMSESMIEGLVKWGIQDLITKMGMKATAASLAGANATASFAAAPWPVDMGAGAFGAQMMGAALAFETGGIVPGVGIGDTVPAMLTPGEAVLPKDLTDGLRSAARSGSVGGGVVAHFHLHQTNHVSTIDGDGIKQVLRDHADEFHAHTMEHIRKLNN
jgi:hypothetical protein